MINLAVRFATLCAAMALVAALVLPMPLRIVSVAKAEPTEVEGGAILSAPVGTVLKDDRPLPPSGPRPTPIDGDACVIDKLGMSAFAGNMAGAQEACLVEIKARDAEIAAWDAWQDEAAWIASTALGARDELNSAGIDYLFSCLFEHAAQGRESAAGFCLGVARGNKDYKNPPTEATSCPAGFDTRPSGVLLGALWLDHCPGHVVEPIAAPPSSPPSESDDDDGDDGDDDGGGDNKKCGLDPSVPFGAAFDDVAMRSSGLWALWAAELIGFNGDAALNPPPPNKSDKGNEHKKKKCH